MEKRQNLTEDIGKNKKMRTVAFVRLLRAMKECREEINQEVEDAFFVRMIFQIEEIDSKYLLKHIMQEVVIFTLCITRVDSYLGIAIANKPHDIACIEFALLDLTDILLPYLIPILFKILRKD